jgi:hypothetical protein
VTDPEVQKEGKKIVEELARLKYELQHDRQMTLAVLYTMMGSKAVC